MWPAAQLSTCLHTKQKIKYKHVETNAVQIIATLGYLHAATKSHPPHTEALDSIIIHCAHTHTHAIILECKRH